MVHVSMMHVYMMHVYMMHVYMMHVYMMHVSIGVGDIIEKIVDSRYISIFSSYWQIIDIEKKIYLGIINFKKMCILFHPINSI